LIGTPEFALINPAVAGSPTGGFSGWKEISMSAILCCDLGGTTADWARYDAGSKDQLLTRTLKVENSEDVYAMLDAVLVEAQRSLPGQDLAITHTTIGVSGPIGSDKAIPTNIQRFMVRGAIFPNGLPAHPW
jgi:glucokinase